MERHSNKFLLFYRFLVFYGVLCLIMLTTITKNYILYMIGYTALGIYFSFLENISALVVWFSTILIGVSYYLLLFLNRFYNFDKIRNFLFSDIMFVFIIFFFTFLTVFSSIYFWSGDYNCLIP